MRKMDIEVTLKDFWDNDVVKTVELDEEEYQNIVYRTVANFFGVDEDIIKTMDLQAFADVIDWGEWRLGKNIREEIIDEVQYLFRKTPEYKSEEGEYKALADEFDGEEAEDTADYKRYLELKKKFGEK